MKDFKVKVLEIAEIAKACPDNLQGICFETLLKHFLAGLLPAPIRPKKDELPLQPAKEGALEGAAQAEITPKKQEDIRETDLHMKVKRFMEKAGVTLEHLNNLFYREENTILPLFDDLKTTRMAESQIRITLLQCLVNAFASGKFETDVEAIRTECGTRKCYDSANFATNLRNNSNLFDFDKFDRTTKTVRLSDLGKKELADIVKELQ